MKASIIICTHNHLGSLRATMAALENVRVPQDIEVELLLVENACTDETSAFVETANLPNMICRALHEPVKGQVRARNRGLAAAQGEFILFIDDDVHPAADWLEKMCAQLATGQYDGVIGRVTLATHLERPWMNRRLRATLAVTEGLEDGWLTEMVGANMAFHRRVLERVPHFDEELGPGALGFGDDSLFSWQIEAAGLRLGRAPEAVVEHHCDASRLLRRNYLESARKSGQSHAYLLHHWRHEEICFPRARLALVQLKLLRRRLISKTDSMRLEGCADWEFSLHAELWRYRQYLHERRRPRNYQRRGLVKIATPQRGNHNESGN
jgi:glycosyltransferase involved in cell wall biosynthesis